MAFFAGKSASILVDTVAKPLDTIDFKSNGEPVDTTNFTSSGWQENVLGIKDVEITASGPYNGISTNVAATDSAGTSVAFVVNFGAGTLTFFARIATVNISTDVRGVGKINYTAKSTGVPTLVY